MKKTYNGVIILGSSRANGDTAKVVSELSGISGYKVINLLDYKISQFDYEHTNAEDDFIPLIKQIIKNYDILIFATPVYWYAMSGIMKSFFDRLTDLLKIEKDYGRLLKGKYMAGISCANSDNLKDAFWVPFRKSAEYLGMIYTTDLHTYEGQRNTKDLIDFKNRIEEIIENS